MKPETWTQLDPTKPGGEKPIDRNTQDSLTTLNPVTNSDQSRETVGSDMKVFKDSPNLYFNVFVQQYGPWAAAGFVLYKFYF